MRCTARARALLRSRLAEDGPRSRAAEREIRTLKLALEQSPAAVVITGLDGTIEYVNTAFQELTGYTSREAVGSNIRMFKSGQQGPAFYQDLWQTILAGKVWRGRFHNRKKNGELFWENATIAPVFDAQGRITCFVAMKEDVTDLMRTEQALQAAKLEADAAAQAKSAFLANMSHEIRTPLNAVLGFIHLLQDTGLTPRQQDYLEKAGVSARHLHAVISDILDYARIEAGRIDLETVPFDLRETLDKVSGILAHRAAEKGLRLSFDLDPGLPALLLGDPLRLGQVLLNLGDNAVKFTEAGAVTCTVRLLERAQGRVRLRFEVRDTGIGMSEADLGGLFQPFTQADGSTTRRFGGTGLGLAISRRLARLMGGDLEGASRAGQGSTFTLVLTLQEAIPGRAGRRGPKALGATTLRGRTVLLVEDDKLNQQVAREILRRAGAGVGLAGNGREALARLGEQPFDAVVMDLQMPVMGGLEAARRIRQDPRWAALPILALTADAVAGVRRKVLAAGMNDAIAKPIDAALLVHTLSGLILEVEGAAGRQAGQIRGVDLPGALARLELDADTYLRLLRRFAEGQAAELAALRAALAQGDRAGAMRLAHSLKGAALNLGANAIGAASRELEEVLGGGAAWREPLARLEERLGDLVESLALTPAPPEATAAAPDWPAILAALAVLRQALREDDAKAGHDLVALAVLLKGGPLQAALAPMKARIENYDYGRALELFPAFEARVHQTRG
jgi:two-component system, sensor histidine kinase and response regulator